MESSPTCSIIQFTTQFHDHVQWKSFLLSVSPFVQWIAFLCFFFRGRSKICFDLRFHGQLCNWMTGLEADLNTLRKQFEPKLMLVPNGFACVLVLCMLVCFGSDLRYVIYIYIGLKVWLEVSLGCSFPLRSTFFRSSPTLAVVPCRGSCGPFLGVPAPQHPGLVTAVDSADCLVSLGILPASHWFFWGFSDKTWWCPSTLVILGCHCRSIGWQILTGPTFSFIDLSAGIWGLCRFMRFFVFLFLIVGLYNDAITATQLETSACNCAKGLVVASNRTYTSECAEPLESGTSLTAPSLQGSTSGERHSQPDRCNVFAAVEVWSMQKDDQRQRCLLSELRIALVEMLGKPIVNFANQRLVLGGTPTTSECKEEAEIQEQVQPSTQVSRRLCQPERKRKRERQGGGQGILQTVRRCSWFYTAFAICQLPSPPCCEPMGPRERWFGFSTADECGSLHDHFLYKFKFGQHRAGCCPATCVSGQGSDAPRCQGASGQSQLANFKVFDQALAHRDQQSWQGQEDVAGNRGGQKGPQASLGEAPGGLCRSLEPSATRVHATASNTGREGEQGHEGYPSCEQSYPESQCSSGWEQRVSTSCCSGRTSRNQSRPLYHQRQRALGEAEEIAEDFAGLRRLSWIKDQQRDPRDRELRGRWRIQKEAAEIPGEGQHCRCFVILGRATTCHSLSDVHGRPRRLTFDPLVEAYGPLGEDGCAACQSFNLAITFDSGDFQLPLGTPTTALWPDYEIDIYAANLKAQQTANCLSFQVACDSIFPVPTLMHRVCERPQAIALLAEQEMTLLPDEVPGDGPLVLIDEWQEVLELVTALQREEDGDCALIMYGLLFTHHSTRCASTGPTIDDLRSTIQNTWMDVIPPGGMVLIHLVKPQEGDIAITRSLKVIVEILPFGIDIPPNDIPTLRCVHWYSDATVTTVAAYLTDQSTGFEILRDSDLHEWCHPWRGTQCNVHLEGQIALLPRRHELRRGARVDIFIPDDDLPEVSDEVGFMQRPRPSRSPDLIPIRLLGLHHVTALLHVNQDEPLMQQLSSNWPLTQQHADDLEAVHFVGFPPQYVSAPPEHLYLMQFRDDRFSQIHTDDVLILLTISFTSPTNTNTQKVRVLWGPRRTTRDQLLGFLRVRWFCAQPTTLCFIYLNNHQWIDRDSVTRRLEFGDHVRIQIRSDRVQWTDFEFSEEVECSMRIFTDSPEPAEQPASESESLSHYTTRSRSRERNRPHAPSNGTESVPEGGGEEE